MRLRDPLTAMPKTSILRREVAKAHLFCKLIELCLNRLGPQRRHQAEHVSQTRQIEARVAGPPRLSWVLISAEWQDARAASGICAILDHQQFSSRDPSYGAGFEVEANAFLTGEVNFSQLQANEPSGQGAGAFFHRLAADFADGTFLGVGTIGGPIGWPIAAGMLPASATGMLFCC